MTMSRKQRRHKLAKFEGFGDLLQRAGVDFGVMADMLAPQGPKKRSLERLASGHSIRLVGAYRAGRLLNRLLEKNGENPIQLNDSIVRTDG
jgi:hypothetical protein